MATYVSSSQWNEVLSQINHFNTSTEFCALFAIDGRVYFRVANDNVDPKLIKKFSGTKVSFPWKSAAGKGVFCGNQQLFN